MNFQELLQYLAIGLQTFFCCNKTKNQTTHLFIIQTITITRTPTMSIIEAPPATAIIMMSVDEKGDAIGLVVPVDIVEETVGKEVDTWNILEEPMDWDGRRLEEGGDVEEGNNVFATID